MDTNSVMHNLRTVGPWKTWKIHVANARARRIVAKLQRIATERPQAAVPFKERHDMIVQTKDMELRLKGLSKGIYRDYLKWVKAHYLKEVIPQRYAELSKQPVRDKVVFMEKEGANTAPNGYISSTLRKQGVYEVVKLGLHRSEVSKLEMYENAVNAVEEMADAKAFFISSGNPVLSQFDVRPETKVIQLWHGCGMFKKVGYSTLTSGEFGASAETRAEYDDYRNYSYVCMPAEEQAWVFEDAMHIPASSGKLVAVGVSRTDQFYDPDFEEKARTKLEERFPQIAGKKIVFYAPTYRGRVSRAYGPDQLDIRAMAESLADEYVLLVKHHGFAKKRPSIPEDLENVFAFDMNKNGILSIERLLAIADICITDYSSIGFEYAILERPIVFFAYDVDQYLDERGMYYDYDEITPGPVCKTTAEVIDYIASLKAGFDKSEIHAFKERYVGMCDGHATERTIALIEAPVR